MVLCGRVSRTYAYQREVNGKTIRVNLGQVGEITAETARLEALKAKKAIESGQNPNVARRIESAKGMRLDEAYELYKKSETRSPKTLELYDTSFRLYLKPWADKHKHTMESIGLDRPGVRKLHEDITATVKAKIEATTRSVSSRTRSDPSQGHRNYDRSRTPPLDPPQPPPTRQVCRIPFQDGVRSPWLRCLHERG